MSMANAGVAVRPHLHAAAMAVASLSEKEAREFVAALLAAEDALSWQMQRFENALAAPVIPGASIEALEAERARVAAHVESIARLLERNGLRGLGGEKEAAA